MSKKTMAGQVGTALWAELAPLEDPAQAPDYWLQGAEAWLAPGRVVKLTVDTAASLAPHGVRTIDFFSHNDFLFSVPVGEPTAVSLLPSIVARSRNSVVGTETVCHGVVIQRSAAAIKNLELARQRVDALRSALASTDSEDLDGAREALEATQEVFYPGTLAVDPTRVNRLGSMLSGPFFTSADFPVPTRKIRRKDRELYPLLQLDLRVASRAIGHRVGDGLLQVWVDGVSDNHLVRVIPRQGAKKSLMTPFEMHDRSIPDFCVPSAVHDGWWSFPFGFKVLQVSELQSGGLQWTALQQQGLDEDFEVFPKQVVRAFQALERVPTLASEPKRSSVQFFGSGGRDAMEPGEKILLSVFPSSGYGNTLRVLYSKGQRGDIAFRLDCPGW